MSWFQSKQLDVIFGVVLVAAIPGTILTSFWGGVPFRLSWWLLLSMVSFLVFMDLTDFYPINPCARWLLIIPYSLLAMSEFLQFALYRPSCIGVIFSVILKV